MSNPSIQQIKLKNLFNAHQKAYATLLYGQPTDFQKTRLRKSLTLLQNEITRILTRQSDEKLNKKQFCMKHLNNKNNSSYFKFTTQKKYSRIIYSTSKRHSYVIKNDNKLKYYIRKHPYSDDVEQSSLSTNETMPWSLDMIFMQQDHSQTSSDNNKDEENNNLGQEENNSMDNGSNNTDNPDLDLDQISTTTDEPKTIQCDGHGKDFNDKNDFMKLLELVPKNDYYKIMNNKNSRKRRTTANPHFSHAAIEAKRLTKMMLAKERRHKRQLALEKQSNSKTELDDYDYFKSQNVFRPQNEMFPGLYSIKTELNMEQSCKICSEICRFSEDTILVCHSCSSVFHLNCLESKFKFPLLDVKCYSCNPLSLQQHQQNFNGDDQKKFIQIKRYISLLQNSNHFLEKLLQKKESYREKHSQEVDILSGQIDRVKNIFKKLNEFRTNSDQGSSNNTTPSKCLTSQESGISIDTNSDKYGISSSIEDDYDNDTSSSDQNNSSSYPSNKESKIKVSNCEQQDQDFSAIISSCA